MMKERLRKILKKYQHRTKAYLAYAKSYHQGRVTKVRSHWRMQRWGEGRKVSQRKLIWEHSMRLTDRRADTQSQLEDAG